VDDGDDDDDDDTRYFCFRLFVICNITICFMLRQVPALECRSFEWWVEFQYFNIAKTVLAKVWTIWVFSSCLRNALWIWLHCTYAL